MKRLHLFNPDNDLALAADTANFTPPRAALELRNSGALLPLWYAAAGDRILCAGVNQAWFDSMRERFNIDVDVFDHTVTPDLCPAPWGWSRAARRTFRNQGFADGALPSDIQLAQWRALSHRHTAAELARRLSGSLDFKIAPPALEFDNIKDLEKYFAGNRRLVVKSPWSSSGRGVMFSSGMSVPELLRRCEGVISRQGSVMVEQVYNRISDFAMLFEIRDKTASFVGYSLFATDASGSYCGNSLISDEEFLNTVGKFYPRCRIEAVRNALKKALDEIVTPFYSGPLGVDMLLYQDSAGSVMPDAAVEINLRMTMGFVAHCLADRYLASGSVGRYYVTPEKTMDSDSIEIADHRLVSGRINLTPPGSRFSFVFEASVL